jgi:hypothetical protein
LISNAPFRSRTVRLTGALTLPAPIDQVFPLFSPQGERDWVPGWDPEIVDPPDGSWRQGSIFRTREEMGEAIWIVTRLDQGRHEVEYHRVEPGRYVAHVEVHGVASSSTSTLATVTYRFIGLSEKGNADIAAMTEEAYAQKMARWAGWIGGLLARRSP